MGKYQEIDRISRAGGDELEMQVAILSIITGKTEAELLRLPIAKYTEIAGKSEFLRRPLDTIPDVKARYKVGKWKLVPCRDYRKLTAGQYIDFQAFTKDALDFCGLLSVLLVPAGMKYADGYDPADVRTAIAEGLSMPDGMALIAFFLKQYGILMRASLTYCENALRKVKDKAMRAKMQERIDHTRSLLNIAGAGLRI